jgi:pre-mRNA-splicing factor SYF1
MMCRSETTDEELGEMTKTNNPEEINIDDEGSTDEDEQVEGS